MDGLSPRPYAGRKGGSTLHDKPGAERIRDLLREAIRAEGLRPGDRLPTEAALTARFGVSRPMLREALKGMELDGQILARRGSGRFVAPAMAVQVERPITAFESVTEMLARAGHQADTRLLSAALVPPPPEVGPTLGALVWRLERLRLVGGKAALYSLEYLPGDLPETDWRGSLVAHLAAMGRRPVMSRATVSAVAAPPTRHDLMGLAEAGPLLLIAETGFTATGEAVVRSLVWHGPEFSFSFARK